MKYPSNGQVLPQPGRSFLSRQPHPFFYSEIDLSAALKKSSAYVAVLRRTSDIFQLARYLDFSLRKRVGLPGHFNKFSPIYALCNICCVALVIPAKAGIQNLISPLKKRIQRRICPKLFWPCYCLIYWRGAIPFTNGQVFPKLGRSFLSSYSSSPIPTLKIWQLPNKELRYFRI